MSNVRSFNEQIKLLLKFYFSSLQLIINFLYKMFKNLILKQRTSINK